MYTITFVLIILGLCRGYSDMKINCVDVGQCVLCSQDEMLEDYCKETGKKMKVTCPRIDDDYRSCNLTAADEQLRVVIFQVMMALIGGLAFWGVQNRKQLNMTLFESRKQG